jgi:hypothetical protein
MNESPDLRQRRKTSHVTASATPTMQGLITLAVGVTVVAGLYFAREVLIPITLAILLSFLVAPLADLLWRLRLGHVVSVFLAVMMSVSVMVVLGGVIATQMTDLATGMPRYQATIEHKMDAAHGLTIGRRFNMPRSKSLPRRHRSARPVRATHALMRRCRSKCANQSRRHSNSRGACCRRSLVRSKPRLLCSSLPS